MYKVNIFVRVIRFAFRPPVNPPEGYGNFWIQLIIFQFRPVFSARGTPKTRFQNRSLSAP